MRYDDYDENEAIHAINKIMIQRKLSYRGLAKLMGKDVSVLTKVLNKPESTRRSLTRKNALAIAMALGFDNIQSLIASVGSTPLLQVSEPSATYHSLNDAEGTNKRIAELVKNVLENVGEIKQLLVTQK